MAKNNWQSRMDIEQYIKDLEDVYQMRIEMDFSGIAGEEETHLCTVTLKGFWLEDDDDESPVAYHQTQVHWKPAATYISNMIRALSEFTYCCLEARMCAISELN